MRKINWKIIVLFIFQICKFKTLQLTRDFRTLLTIILHDQRSTWNDLIYRSAFAWPKSDPAGLILIRQLLLPQLSQIYWPPTVSFMESLTNFELKLASVPSSTMIIFTISACSRRNMQDPNWVWFCQFLVDYSYVPPNNPFWGRYWIALQMAITSCTVFAHSCIH